MSPRSSIQEGGRGAQASLPPLFLRFFAREALIRHFAFLCSAFVVLLVLAFLFVLTRGAWPSFHSFGFGFLVGDVWNPVTDQYGAFAAVYGTIVTAIIALCLALPVGMGIAFFLVELAPEFIVKPLRIAIELLAGIPSIVYGFWGLFVIAPIFQDSVQPFLIEHLGGLPLIGVLFGGPAFGVGFLTAGFVLAIMILPFLAAFLTDIFETVSPLLKESAYALGSTQWEVVRDIMTPSVKGGMMSGIMLALGRALGETMAVTFVIGNAHKFSASILAPGTTISASIANEFNEATSDLHTSSLLALGVILFAITFLMLAGSKITVWILEQQGRRS